MAYTVIPPDPTILSWRRIILTDGNQYSWAFTFLLATLPNYHFSLINGDTRIQGSAKARHMPAMIAQADLDNLSRPVHA